MSVRKTLCSDWVFPLRFCGIVQVRPKISSLDKPATSPDLNPIEQAYSKLKAHLRRNRAKTFTEVFEAIGAICDLYNQEECWNYFKGADYAPG